MVFCCADAQEFQYVAMASSREKFLNPSDINRTLENDEFTEKLADFDDSEFSDTDESSESVFHDVENYVLLLNSVDDNDGNNSAPVTSINFMWEDMVNYSV
jgi:hypothetical protein